MRNILIFLLLFALMIVLNSAVYTVNEAEQVILTQFGRPIGDRVIDEPGLHYKLPFVQKVNRFDQRYLEWDGEANQLPTRDKRFIWVDTYARWRISDPLLYFQRLRDENGAQRRLDDILDGETRNSIANHDLVEVVRASNREPAEDATLSEEERQILEPIEYGRERIRQEILQNAQQRTGDLGIEILDVRLKRVNYIEDVRKNVYDRMISERNRIATRFRSEGEGEASRIRGEMERDLKQIESEAYKDAEEIRGDADAEATGVYAEAYNQSGASRDFYDFLKSMETLTATVDGETTLLLSTDGEFYRYLENSSP